jgi:hypothetical protein
MKQDIEKIIFAGTQAPSGHNAQPWEFVVEGDTIHIVNLPDEDTTIFNFNQNGAFIAHGAALENMIIAAAEYGYEAVPIIDTEMRVKNSIVSLRVTKKDVPKNSLYPFIATRLTNRTPYKNIPLTQEESADLFTSAKQIGAGSFQLVEEKSKRKQLAKAFSINDRMLFENFAMHQAVFPHLNWTEEEEKTKKRGLYLKTLELPPPIQKAFKLFARWPIARFLGKIGMGKMAAKQNDGLYASSPAIGAIIFDNESLENFVLSGRMLQRIWLTATKLGLDLAPLAGTLYVTKRILSGQASEFSPEQIRLFTEAHQSLYDVFGINMKEKKILMTFRMGRGSKPTAHSVRALPRIIYK